MSRRIPYFIGGGSLPMVPAVGSGFAAPDIYSHDFNDGTSGPYFVTSPTNTTFPDDPTGSGRGKILQIRYNGTGLLQDINRMITGTAIGSGYGSNVFFRGYLHFPTGTVSFSNVDVQRKLFYLRNMNAPFDYFLVVHMWGDQLQVEWSRDGGDAISSFVFTASMGVWYRMEIQATFNSSVTAADGIIRVWIDGTLVYEDLAVHFTANTWTGATPVWSEVMVGVQREGTDTGGGAPENNIDENRYWDNVAFSTTRIGP